MAKTSKVEIPIEIVGIEKVSLLVNEMDKKIAELIHLADEIKTASSEITISASSDK